MNTLEDYLRQNADLYPDKVAVMCAGKETSYAELYRMVCDRAEAIMHAQDYKPGLCCVVRNSQDIEFLIEYFALHLAKSIAVPVEKDVPDSRIADIEAIVSKESFADDIADILFTTGTTGTSKGVMISHSTILADAENLVEAQGFTHDVRFLINGPLNHIGSLSKIYPTVMVGGTLVIIDGMKDINAFFEALDYCGTCIGTFLVPACIRMLIQFSEERLAGYADKIDFIETGAAPIAESDMKQLCKVLPHSRLFNTYASTETGIIATHNFNSDVCVAGCLGKAMKNSRFFISDEGTVACTGKTLMSGYVGDPAKTAEVLRDGVLYTSDSARIDDEGRLHLMGRKDDVINIGGFKVAPTEVEDVAMSHPSVKDCICITGQHPVIGTVLKLLVVTNDDAKLDKRSLAMYIKSKIESHKVPFLYEQVEKINRTYNGKLDRKSYVNG